MSSASRTHPFLLLAGRTLALCFGLSVAGYLVYCAQRDANRKEPDKKDGYIHSSKSFQPEREVFLPSSKAAPPRLPEELKPRDRQKRPPGKQAPSKKKKQPDVFIPSSKSGVLRLPVPDPKAEAHGG